MLGISRSNNPIDGFVAVQFVGDTTGAHFNSFTTIAADARGVFVTTNNEIDPDNQSVSIYAIPKADLLGTVPSLSNLERVAVNGDANLDPDVFGSTIQFASDANGDSARSLGLGTFDSGSSALSVIEIENLGTGLPVVVTNTLTAVETYLEAPDGRQINDIVRLAVSYTHLTLPTKA